MTKDHEDARRRKRVAEPVQVYLEQADRERLERLAGQLGATKSDVLRRGLAALERDLRDPATHPALRLIAIAERETASPAQYDAFVPAHGWSPRTWWSRRRTRCCCDA